LVCWLTRYGRVTFKDIRLYVGTSQHPTT